MTNVARVPDWPEPQLPRILFLTPSDKSYRNVAAGADSANSHLAADLKKPQSAEARRRLMQLYVLGVVFAAPPGPQQRAQE